MSSVYSLQVRLPEASCPRRFESADLVECCDKAGVVVEGGHDQSVVLLVDIEGRLHVHFGVLEETQASYLYLYSEGTWYTDHRDRSTALVLFNKHDSES